MQATVEEQFDRTDRRITGWMADHGLTLLRLALGLVFSWFGALKLIPGASPAEALAGPPAAPFPVRRRVRTDLRLLQVSPFGLKYTVRRFDSARLRPYVAAGLDFAVTITHQDPVDDESLAFTGTAPFDAPLIGGQIAQAPELAERGYPTGQGNIDLGFHAAGGLEIRFARRASLNAEYRFTSIGGDAGLHAVTTALGFHW